MPRSGSRKRKSSGDDEGAKRRATKAAKKESALESADPRSSIAPESGARSHDLFGDRDHTSSAKPSSEKLQEAQQLVNDLLAFDPKNGAPPVAATTAGLERLTAYLEPNNKMVLPWIATPVQVVQVLLPWLTHTLTQDKPAAAPPAYVVWNAFHACVMCHDDNASTVWTQNVLGKLVAVVQGRVLQELDSDGADDRVGALNRTALPETYSGLLARYTPTSLETAMQILQALVEPMYRRNDARALTPAIVVAATVQWMTRLHESKANNPKTVFGVLAQPHAWSILSKAHALLLRSPGHDVAEAQQNRLVLVPSLLQHTLFHRRHHLDGHFSLLSSRIRITTETIKSESSESAVQALDSHDKAIGQVSPTKPASTFHCYQEQLFDGLEDVKRQLTESSSILDNSSMADLYANLRLLPLLLRGLFAESEARERDNVSTKETRGGGIRRKQQQLAMLQFRFFAFITELLQKSVVMDASSVGNHDTNTTLPAAALQSVSDCVGALLEFNVYLPTQDDKHASQFRFLDKVIQMALQVLTNHATDAMRDEALTLLRHALRLNHLLVHDRLVDIMTLLAGSGAAARRSISLSETETTLTVTCVETYSQLRQLDHYIRAFLRALENLSDRDDTSATAHLAKLLHETSVVNALGRAIDACPPQQLSNILDFLIVWIGGEKTSKYGEAATDVWMDLTTAVMQNARVEKITALNVAEKTQYIVKVLVDKSHGIWCGNNLSNSTDRQLTFIARAATLHTRCAFFLADDCSRFTCPAIVIECVAMMTEAALKTPSSFQCDVGGLLHFTCSQLRDLGEGMSSAHDGGEQEKKGKAMAALAAVLAERGDKDGSHSWNVLAQNLSIWIRHASDADLNLYARWIVDVYADNCHNLLPAENSDVQTVMILLRDRLVHDHAPLRNAVVLSALARAEHHLQDKLTSKSARQQFSMESLGVPSLLQLLRYRQPANRMEAFRSVALRPCGALVNLCQEILSNTETVANAAVLYRAFHVDATLSSFQSDRGAIAADLLRVLAMSRRLCVSIILTYDATPLLQSISQTMLEEWCVAYRESAVTMCKATPDDKDIDQFIDATTALIDVLLRAGQKPFSPTFFATLVDANSNDTVTLKIAAALGRLAVKMLDGVGQTQHDVCVGLIRQLAQSILAVEWHSSVHLYGFVGDVVQVDDTLLRSLVDTWILGDCLRDRGNIFACACAIKANRLQGAECTQILKILINRPAKDEILEMASIVRLLAMLTLDELRSIMLEVLAVSAPVTSNASTLHRLRILTAIVKSLANYHHETYDALQMPGHEVFAAIVRALTSTASSKIAEVALKLSVELTKTRGLLIFRDFDIAVLLSRMTTCGLGDCSARTAVSLMRLKADLLLALFQRYAKLMYTCAPTVVRTLQHLMRFATQASADDSGAPQRAQILARVLEQIVLHRDVYKKHLVGLVVDFVPAVQAMGFRVRESFLPSCFYLLDALTSHEMKQLNVMMSTDAKGIFRGVYAMYQKSHAYKGQ